MMLPSQSRTIRRSWCAPAWGGGGVGQVATCNSSTVIVERARLPSAEVSHTEFGEKCFCAFWKAGSGNTDDEFRCAEDMLR